MDTGLERSQEMCQDNLDEQCWQLESREQEEAYKHHRGGRRSNMWGLGQGDERWTGEFELG